MPRIEILWDASGLVKRYYEEPGSETVDALFATPSPHTMRLTPWGYAETYGILLRRLNGGVLRQSTFEAAASNLHAEVLDPSGFDLLTISDVLIFGSLTLMQAHNINSADAAILATYLKFQQSTQAPCLLVSSDKRLLRAAKAERLPGLNPEETAPDDTAATLLLLERQH